MRSEVLTLLVVSFFLSNEVAADSIDCERDLWETQEAEFSDHDFMKWMFVDGLYDHMYVAQKQSTMRIYGFEKYKAKISNFLLSGGGLGLGGANINGQIIRKGEREDALSDEKYEASYAFLSSNDAFFKTMFSKVKKKYGEGFEYQQLVAHPTCEIVRRVKEYDVKEIYVFVNETASAEQAARCLVASAFSYKGFSNVLYIFKEAGLLKKDAKGKFSFVKKNLTHLLNTYYLPHKNLTGWLGQKYIEHVPLERGLNVKNKYSNMARDLKKLLERYQLDFGGIAGGSRCQARKHLFLHRESYCRHWRDSELKKLQKLPEDLFTSIKGVCKAINIHIQR